MYYRQKYRRREKLKKAITAALYFLILLAETGEFFVPRETYQPDPHEQEHHKKEEHHAEAKVHLEIPDHIPENHKEADPKPEKEKQVKTAQKKQELQRWDLDKELSEIYSRSIL